MPTTPEETANALLEEFKSTLAEHACLSETLAQILSHDEDELLLSEWGYNGHWRQRSRRGRSGKKSSSRAESERTARGRRWSATLAGRHRCGAAV